MAKKKAKKPAQRAKVSSAAAVEDTHVVITERVTETAKYYAKLALKLEREAHQSRGFDKVRLLSESRQMVKLALKADESGMDAKVASAIKALEARSKAREVSRGLQ